VQNLQYWVGIGYKPTWEGAHILQYPSDTMIDLQIFLDEIQFLSKVRAFISDNRDCRN